MPRVALLLWSGTMLAVIVAAPLAASAARPEGWFLYEVFAPFCHQQAERAWHLQGHPLAVCARCVGFYGGVLLAALAGLRLPAKTIGAALALIALTWGVEFAGVAAVSNEIRSLTGLVLGASIAASLLALTPGRAPRWLARPESAG